MTTLGFAFLSSCVPLENLPQPPGVTPQSIASFPDLDPGANSLTSLHFVLRGYTDGDLYTVSALAEDMYNKISNDTGLYSYLASGSYTLVIYRDRDEYLQKTRQPGWSRAVTAGTSVYTYAGPDLGASLAHELTHVVFNSFMGGQAPYLRWLNEGLAMVEETSRMPPSEREAFQQELRTRLRQEKIPFSQMTFFIPATEERRRVDAWYLQVCSVTTFLLGQGSGLNFGAFMNDLRAGTDIDRALQNNYPGRFPSFRSLEEAWKATI